MLGAKCLLNSAFPGSPVGAVLIQSEGWYVKHVVYFVLAQFPLFLLNLVLITRYAVECVEALSSPSLRREATGNLEKSRTEGKRGSGA